MGPATISLQCRGAHTRLVLGKYVFVLAAYALLGVQQHVDRRSPPFRTTGHVASLLGVTEPRLSELVRRGHVNPPPIILAGRRLWNTEQLLQAAAMLKVMSAEILDRLRQEGTDV